MYQIRTQWTMSNMCVSIKLYQLKWASMV